MHLQPFSTTVVGAYSLPRWDEVLERQVEAGLLTSCDMADAQWRATWAAFLDQEVAGIDIVNGGELHRRQNNRHAPRNDWQKIPGFEKDLKAEYSILIRPRAITPKDPKVFHPAAVCTGPMSHGDLGLVEEFNFIASNARHPKEVKITMTGPHMLAKVAYDEYYGGNLTRIMQDLAKVINANLMELDKAGCQHVQIDEPLLVMRGLIEVRSLPPLTR